MIKNLRGPFESGPTGADISAEVIFLCLVDAVCPPYNTRKADEHYNELLSTLLRKMFSMLDLLDGFDGVLLVTAGPMEETGPRMKDVLE